MAAEIKLGQWINLILPFSHSGFGFFKSQIVLTSSGILEIRGLLSMAYRCLKDLEEWTPEKGFPLNANLSRHTQDLAGNCPLPIFALLRMPDVLHSPCWGGGGNVLTIQRDRFHPRDHPFIPLVSAPCLSCLFFINPYVKADISLYTQKKCGESFNISLPQWPCVCLLGSNSLVFKFMSNRPARLPLLASSTEIPAHSCVHACTHTHTHTHTSTHMHAHAQTSLRNSRVKSLLWAELARQPFWWCCVVAAPSCLLLLPSSCLQPLSLWVCLE